jgi:hypothetical protein
MDVEDKQAFESPSAQLLGELERALHADLERERGPLAWLRSQSRPVRLGILLLVASSIALLTLHVAPRPDLAGYPRLRMIVTLAWFAIGVGGTAWVALRPIYLPRPERGVVALVAAFAGLGPVVTSLLPAAPMEHAYAHQLWPWAYGCFAAGTTASLAVLLAARAIDRGGALSLGQIVLASLAAGLVGNVALQLHCPVNYPLHLLLGHATVPVGLVLGTWFARRAAEP